MPTVTYLTLIWASLTSGRFVFVEKLLALIVAEGQKLRSLVAILGL